MNPVCVCCGSPIDAVSSGDNGSSAEEKISRVPREFRESRVKLVQNGRVVAYSENSFRLARCTNGACKQVVDKYVEYEFILIVLDMALLRTQAYRHAIFNRSINYRAMTWFKAIWAIALVDAYLMFHMMLESERLRGHGQSPGAWDTFFHFPRFRTQFELYILFVLFALLKALSLVFQGSVLSMVSMCYSGYSSSLTTNASTSANTNTNTNTSASASASASATSTFQGSFLHHLWVKLRPAISTVIIGNYGTVFMFLPASVWNYPLSILLIFRIYLIATQFLAFKCFLSPREAEPSHYQHHHYRHIATLLVVITILAGIVPLALAETLCTALLK